MIEETFSVNIRRKPEDVFRILTDFEHYLARWAKGPVAARKLTTGDGVGTRFTVVARVGPLRATSPYEVKIWEPPAEFGGSGVAGPVAFDEQYSLAAAGDGDADTNLCQRIVARPRGPFRLVEGVVRRQLRQLIAADLERFRVLVEAEA
ncbi:MAG TPA: SRPBCC family protein [Acidimicrobiales bacterium]|nr:SRPBCC family protein [Acidimicrobiales bacterium]